MCFIPGNEIPKNQSRGFQTDFDTWTSSTIASSNPHFFNDIDFYISDLSEDYVVPRNRRLLVSKPTLALAAIFTGVGMTLPDVMYCVYILCAVTKLISMVLEELHVLLTVGC